MKKYQFIIEKSETDYWVRVEVGEDLLTTVAPTKNQAVEQLKSLLVTEWQILNPEIEELYDLSAFFETFDVLKINAVAQLADLNPSLLRQYVSGHKHPSWAQVQKIQSAIHQLAHNLSQIRLE